MFYGDLDKIDLKYREVNINKFYTLNMGLKHFFGNLNEDNEINNTIRNYENIRYI